MFTVGGPIETALTNMTGWTGSLFLTLLIILIVIIVIGLALPLPMEWTALFVVPLLFGINELMIVLSIQLEDPYYYSWLLY